MEQGGGLDEFLQAETPRRVVVLFVACSARQLLEVRQRLTVVNTLLNFASCCRQEYRSYT